VGYGDIHPQSTFGKVLALVLIFGGVGTFLGIVASVTEIFLKRREDAFRREKLNMVAGLFFSELGTELLRQCAKVDPEVGVLYQNLKVTSEWTDADFRKAGHLLHEHSFSIDSQYADLPALREYLQNRANFLLRMLENPMLHEHGNFAELLRAIFHLRDELISRTNLTEMLDSDRKHLEGDMVRIYELLVIEWLAYMRYLRDNYGYMLSLAMRVNPFDPHASAVVTGS
jgi:hypothetical protein